MSDAFLERLSRFTPASSGLDRDALLYEAGRASMRPRRGWMALAGLLAASQLVTLVALWPATSVPVAPAVASVQPTEVLPPPEASTSAGGMTLAVVQRTLLTTGELPPLEPMDDMVPQEPPQRALGVGNDLLFR